MLSEVYPPLGLAYYLPGKLCKNEIIREQHRSRVCDLGPKAFYAEMMDNIFRCWVGLGIPSHGTRVSWPGQRTSGFARCVLGNLSRAIFSIGSFGVPGEILVSTSGLQSESTMTQGEFCAETTLPICQCVLCIENSS